jgi:hypothetical protein
MSDPFNSAGLIDAWRTNNLVTMYLVERLPATLWPLAVPGAPRRTVRSIAGDLHNSRCRWIKGLGAAHGILPPPFVDLQRGTPTQVVRALARSSDGIVRLMELGAANGGMVPRSSWQNFPTDLPHFLSYFVAHEAHHRGQLIMLARQLGHRLPGKVVDGVWQWISRRREHPHAS